MVAALIAHSLGGPAETGPAAEEARLAPRATMRAVLALRARMTATAPHRQRVIRTARCSARARRSVSVAREELVRREHEGEDLLVAGAAEDRLGPVRETGAVGAAAEDRLGVASDQPRAPLGAGQ